MSSPTQSHESSDTESSGLGYASSAEEGVAGPRPQAADPAQPAIQTYHVSTKFALSLLKRLKTLKVVPPRKKLITEEDAVDILASMLATTGNADKNIRYVLIPSTWPNDREQITEEEAADLIILLGLQG